MNPLDLIKGIEDALADGYTLDGYIAEVPGVHGPLSFTYRPIDPITRSKTNVLRGQVIGSSTLSEEQKEIACQYLGLQLVAGNVQSWDLVDGKGEAVAPSAVALLRYFPGYRLRRLTEIVGDGLQSDWRPDAKPSDPPPPESKLPDAEKNW